MTILDYLRTKAIQYPGTGILPTEREIGSSNLAHHESDLDCYVTPGSLFQSILTGMYVGCRIKAADSTS